MTLIDAFPLFNELDILEIRLRTLYEFVDMFVLVEATRTHKGDSKPLHFQDNRARFKEWLPKIRHIIVDDMPGGDGLAGVRRREMFQRNAILRGLSGDVRDDDLLLISDCDEIPRPELLNIQGLQDGMVLTYVQRLYYYNLNTYAPERPWPGTRLCHVADARCISPHIIRNGMALTDTYYPVYGAVMDGGWHFSYFGGTERIQTKMTQFLHQELVTTENTTADAIADKVTRGVDIWGREGEQEFVIGPSTDLPNGIMADPMQWRHLFHPDYAPTFHENWYVGEQALFVGLLAQRAPEGQIVEIGSWEGKSACILAQKIAPRVLHVVDHWQGNLTEGEANSSVAAARERDVFATFCHNARVLTPGNIVTHRMGWEDWVKTIDEPIAFLHLDAGHTYDDVHDCLLALKPYLAPGAILCGDDAYAEPVRQGVASVFPDAKVAEQRLWLVKWEGD